MITTEGIRCLYCGSLLVNRRIDYIKDCVIDSLVNTNGELLRVEEDEKGFTDIVEVRCKVCGVEREVL